MLIGLGIVVVLLVAYSVFSIARPDRAPAPRSTWMPRRTRSGRCSPTAPPIPTGTRSSSPRPGDLITGDKITNVLRDTAGKETTFTRRCWSSRPGPRIAAGSARSASAGSSTANTRSGSKPLPGGRSRLIQQETFPRRRKVPVMASWLNNKIKPQFTAMNPSARGARLRIRLTGVEYEGGSAANASG